METWHTSLMKILNGTDMIDEYLLAICKMQTLSDKREYAQLLHTSGIMERARRHFYDIANMHTDESPDAKINYDKLTDLQNLFISNFFNSNAGICECGTAMEIIEDKSELHCPFCAKIETLSGVIFRKQQLHAQSNNQIKSNTYMPGKHFNEWIRNIQGTDDTILPDKLIAKLKAVLARDGIHTREINCSIIRKYLREIKRIKLDELDTKNRPKTIQCSKYAAFATKIVEKITSRQGPRLTEGEHRRLLHKFDIIIGIYDRHISREMGKTNRPHYPYFIYKLIDQDEQIDDARKRVFRDAIPMQNSTTVSNNDIIFNKICKIISRDYPDLNIRYKPTIYHKL